MIPKKPVLMKILETLIWDGLNERLRSGMTGPRELIVIGTDDTILIKMDGKKFFLNVYEEGAPGTPNLLDPAKMKNKKK